MNDKCDFVTNERVLLDGTKHKNHCGVAIHCEICKYCVRHCLQHFMIRGERTNPESVV